MSTINYHWGIDEDDKYNCPLYTSGLCSGSGKTCKVGYDNDSCPILYWASRMEFVMEAFIEDNETENV